MESLLEVLIGLYFAEADSLEEGMSMDREYRTLYSAIENTEIEDILKSEIYRIEYESGEISEEIYRLMTDETFGK